MPSTATVGSTERTEITSFNK